MRTIPEMSLLLALAAALPAQTARYTLLGTGCAGSMPVTSLAVTTLPVLGATMQVELGNLPDDLGIVFTSFSSTTSPLGALPLELGVFGMPGCWLRTGTESATFLAGLGHRATWSLRLPAQPGCLGLTFHQQALVPDTLAGNGAAAVVSDAMTAVIGLRDLPSGTPIDGMVAIAPGTFAMGSGAFVATYEPSANELPVHTVTITYPFWMGRNLVTQDQYRLLTNLSPSAFPGPNRPVERVTWYDAMAYCALLTAQEAAAARLPAGYEYRLPTEAEWEYCCRAGTTSEWNVGASLSCADANHLDERTLVLCEGHPSDVGSYSPNAWGLFDLHGNVFEWCLDGWDASANYPAGPVADPFVDGATGPYRMARGGAWNQVSLYCRSAFRYGHLPTHLAGDFGFRIVLAPVQLP